MTHGEFVLKPSQGSDACKAEGKGKGGGEKAWWKKACGWGEMRYDEIAVVIALRGDKALRLSHLCSKQPLFDVHTGAPQLLPCRTRPCSDVRVENLR